MIWYTETNPIIIKNKQWDHWHCIQSNVKVFHSLILSRCRCHQKQHNQYLFIKEMTTKTFIFMLYTHILYYLVLFIDLLWFFNDKKKIFDGNLFHHFFYMLIEWDLSEYNQAITLHRVDDKLIYCKGFKFLEEKFMYNYLKWVEHAENNS